MSKDLIKIKNVEITPDGYLLKKRRVLLAGLVNGTLEDLSLFNRLQLLWQHYVKPRLRQPKKLFRDLFKKPAECIDENCIWITDDWSDGYFHWITEALPRLLHFEETEKELNQKTLLLPSKYKHINYVNKSLEYFSVKAIKYVNSNQKVLVKNLLLSPHIVATGVHDKKYLYKLRKKYRNIFKNFINRNKEEKIYISRSKSKRRKAVNNKEVESILKKNDFKIVNFENHSWQDQIRMCLNAKYLVGIHGAGLTNMVFMRNDGTVLEFVNKKYYNKCFRLMADKLNLNYLNQKSKPRKNTSDFLRVSDNHKNLIINPATLEKNIKLMFGNNF